MTDIYSAPETCIKKPSAAPATNHKTKRSGHDGGKVKPANIMMDILAASIVVLVVLAFCEQVRNLFSTSPITHSPTAFIVSLTVRLFNIALGVLEVPFNAAEGVLRMVNEAFRTASIGDLSVFTFSWGFSYCMWKLYCLGYQFLQDTIDEDARIKQSLIDYEVKLRLEEMRQKEADATDKKKPEASRVHELSPSPVQAAEQQVTNPSGILKSKVSRSPSPKPQREEATTKTKIAPLRPPRPSSSKSARFFPIEHRNTCHDIDCPCGVALQEWENMVMLKEMDDEFIVVTGRQ